MKRPAKSSHKSTNGAKRRKPNASESSSKSKKAKASGPKNAFDRAYIPIPVHNSADSDLDENEEDAEFFGEQSASFLQSLDEKAISRSKKEIERLHQFTKPVRTQQRAEDDLPSVHSNSGDEYESDWSGIGGNDDDDDVLSDSDMSSSSRQLLDDSDDEQPYERVPRAKAVVSKAKELQRLPIKMADGSVHATGSRTIVNEEDTDDDEEDEDEWDAPPEMHKVEDVSTGARFGRPAVVDVLRIASRKQRVQTAKEQIASLSQEVIADPENNLALLRRLSTFSLVQVVSPSYPEPVPNDPIIRKLAMISQMAVFRDVAPGYRIRQLTDKEKSEKVSQIVQRTRDWEQGLVMVYQSYLRILHDEVKSKSELASTALQCLCTLLTELTHFNFRTNIMGAIVEQLSRKSWNASSELCLRTVISVFKNDQVGEASLEFVRLLNRMIKERRFMVHGNVLSCLFYLRLKSELAVRASDTKVDRDDDNRGGQKHGKGKGKAKSGEPQHVSKKQKKALKEKKEIEKEMREADAEVDREERSKTHTETLKLLFALYFRVLKNPERTPLLTPALRGISRFAHLVNIDFFRDLLKVLQEHVARSDTDPDAEDDISTLPRQMDMQYRLQCIVTAFELLSGQGEAITIDLEDFVTQLYGLIPALALLPGIETPLDSAAAASSGTGAGGKDVTLSSMLLRALSLALAPRHLQQVGTAHSSPTRTAAFVKRLIMSCLTFPPHTAQQVIAFVRTLLAKDARLEALFTSDERCNNGRYRPELDDPQLTNPWSTSCWEIVTLCERHWNDKVREEATLLADFVRE